MKIRLNAKGPIAALLFCSLLSCSAAKKDDSAKEESYGAAPVKVAKAVRRKIAERLFLTGTLEAWQKANITPDIGGKVAKINVREGDRVVRGQLLAEMDTKTIRLQMRQAEAAAAVAEAGYLDAKRDLERLERLIKEKAVSEQQFEKVKLAFEAARAQREQAQAALNLARHSLDVSLMKAPFSGVIASKNAEVGDVINPMMGGFGQTGGVLTLMDFSRVKIGVEVSQSDILRIRKGQKALLRVPSFPDREFLGTVHLVYLTADPATKKFRAEVAVDNPDLTLRPGTFGEVILEISTREDALVIPQKSIMENRFVFVAEGNQAHKKEVTLGLQNSLLVEVLNGLKEGDLIIVEGNFGLEDGGAVEIIEEVKK